MHHPKSSTTIYFFCSVTITVVIIAKFNIFTEHINKSMYSELLPSTRSHGYKRHEIHEDLFKLPIYPPSRLPYRLSKPEIKNPSHGQSQIIDNFFHNKTNGFFIESGAYDGERLSNTLFLERFRNWTGLLVEPNPSLFIKLNMKNRQAYAINSCLSTKKYPTIEMFNVGRYPVSGHIVEDKKADVNGSQDDLIRVQCFPLFSILQAINRFEIDYFSLDVEGAEEGVLKTLPWERINIKTISIEHNKWPGGKYALFKFMKRLRYKLLTEIKNVNVAPDFIFQKEIH